MKLIRLEASYYRSLKDVGMTFEPLNLLIGANASGKSNVLDALRLLSEGIRAKDFSESVADRGGIIHLAWKGEGANQIRLVTRYEHQDKQYEWTVGLRRQPGGFSTWEWLHELHVGSPPTQLLDATSGKVEWWSEQAKDNTVKLLLPPTTCALAAACADESFRARAIGEFIQRWGFFDPSPPLLRRASNAADAERLDAHGRNLAARLYALQQAPDGIKTVKRIVTAVRRVLGVPDEITLRLSEYDGRAYFVQSESGLAYDVHQIGASSGTLRMLALMTALFGETDTSLVGIEEPENNIHPAALKAFAEYLRDATERVQIVVTTHSPLLLDCLPKPKEIAIVRRTGEGTKIEREQNPEAVDQALEDSGFGLGEFYETKGFGA